MPVESEIEKKADEEKGSNSPLKKQTT